eukprot:1662241-Pyramimonas_sp.AAC.1
MEIRRSSYIFSTTRSDLVRGVFGPSQEESSYLRKDWDQTVYMYNMLNMNVNYLKDEVRRLALENSPTRARRSSTAIAHLFLEAGFLRRRENPC